ncbi:MAG: hypothetical protein MHMPM18_001261 [Marteilia pararefringens]
MTNSQSFEVVIRYQELAIQALIIAAAIYLLKDILCMLYLLIRECCPCFTRRISPTEEMIISLMFYYQYIHDKTANSISLGEEAIKEKLEHIKKAQSPSLISNPTPYHEVDNRSTSDPPSSIRHDDYHKRRIE